MLTRDEALRLVEQHVDELDKQKKYWESIQRALKLMLLRQTLHVLENTLLNEDLNPVERSVYTIFINEVQSNENA